MSKEQRLELIKRIGERMRMEKAKEARKAMKSC